MAGGSPRFVPLVEEENFALDLDALEHAVTRRTVAVLFCNPNNPTGTVYSRSQLERLVEIAERHDLLLVSRRSLQGLSLQRRGAVHAGADRGRARPRRARVFVLEGVRHDRLAHRVPAFGPAKRGRDPQGPRRAGDLRSGGLAVRRAGRTGARPRDGPSISARVPRAAKSDARASRSAVAHLRLPETERLLLRLPASQGHGAAGSRLPPARARHPRTRPRRPRARHRLRPERRGALANLLQPKERRDHGSLRETRRLLPWRDRKPVPAKTADPDRLPLAAQPAAPSGPPSWRRSNLFPRARLAAITYLGWLARRYLARVRPRCVAIAGLQGKTVMKRWLREHARADAAGAGQSAFVQYRARPAARDPRHLRRFVDALRSRGGHRPNDRARPARRPPPRRADPRNGAAPRGRRADAQRGRDAGRARADAARAELLERSLVPRHGGAGGGLARAAGIGPRRYRHPLRRRPPARRRHRPRAATRAHLPTRPDAV